MAGEFGIILFVEPCMFGVEETLPMDARGLAYRAIDAGMLFLDDSARLGGAINAASGSSLDTAAGVDDVSAFGVIIVGGGGGAKLLAFSVGSSPGNTQILSSG